MRLNRIPAPKHRMINLDLPDVDDAKVNIKEAEVLLQAGVLVMPVVKNDQGDGWIVTLAGKYKLNPKLEIMRVFKRHGCGGGGIV